jgi:hypothetical protein
MYGFFSVPLAAKKFICLGDAYVLILGSNVGTYGNVYNAVRLSELWHWEEAINTQCHSLQCNAKAAINCTSSLEPYICRARVPKRTRSLDLKG